MSAIKLGTMIKRSAFKADGIPLGIVDRFERECPEAVIKMNPMAKNSTRLYDRKKFDTWWEECCRAQHMPVKRGVM